MTTYILLGLIAVALVGGLIAILVKYGVLRRVRPAGVTPDLKKVGAYVSVLVMIAALVFGNYLIFHWLPSLWGWMFTTLFSIIVGVLLVGINMAVVFSAISKPIPKVLMTAFVYFFATLVFFAGARGICSWGNIDSFGIVHSTPIGNNLLGGLTVVEKVSYFPTADSSILAVDVPLEKDGVVVLSPGGREMHYPMNGGSLIILEVYPELVRLPAPYERYQVGHVGAQEVVQEDGRMSIHHVAIPDLEGFKLWQKEKLPGQFAVCDECNLGQLLVITGDRAWPVVIGEAVPVPKEIRDTRIMFTVNVPHHVNERGNGRFIVKFAFTPY